MSRKISVRRRLIDFATSRIVGAGGFAVVAIAGFMLGYLLLVVAPMFKAPQMTWLAPLPIDADTGAVQAIGSHDALEFVYLIGTDSDLLFVGSEAGNDRQSEPIAAQGLVKTRRVFPGEDTFALLDTAGILRLLKISHRVRFERGERTLDKRGDLLFAGTGWPLGNTRDFDVYREADLLKVAHLDHDGTIEVSEFANAVDDLPLELTRRTQTEANPDLVELRWGARGQFLYALDDNAHLSLYRVARSGSPQLLVTQSLVTEGRRVSAIVPLLGHHSWMVADDQGELAQWTSGQDAEGAHVHKVRTFSFASPIVQLAAEHRRKGLVALDAADTLHLVHTTSERVLASSPSPCQGVQRLAFSPRGDRLFITCGEGLIQRVAIHNEYPEVSWASLWRALWYEGYPQPSYTWQSSASQTDFEPKFSLTPLLFGTFKAAFYAMLFAAPLAVFGALYTACFMAPSMRRLVKPGIEIMAAMPTVVLGFIAGLWLAPLIEANLTATLCTFPVLPLAVLLIAWVLSRLPNRLTRALDGWMGLACIPVICVCLWGLFACDDRLEALIFAGDAQAWFRDVAGLGYDQRNALVVGIAMGLAIIPIIFTISEDAIYGVPRRLTSGSLALGATPWQTMTRLVIHTASPGIFSALMVGFGRAIGETMIVLMAAGNTPIMDMNIFSGMRTFAANIAVELPESEAGSSHYRILFLTALVLFAVTFIFNTIAEIVRTRLRARYARL